MTLFINGSFLSQQQTGVQRYAREITKQLLSNGNVKLLHRSEHQQQLSNYANSLVVPDSFFTKYLFKQCWALWDVQSKLKSTDVLWHPANIALPLRGRHIVTIHDMSVYAGPEWFSRSFLAKYYAFLPLVANRSYHILTVSEFSKSEIIRYLKVKPSKVSVGYNGVCELFTPSNQSDVQNVKVKSKLDRKYVLSVGTLEPRKNLKTLIEAWKISGLAESHDLILVGGKVNIFSNAGFEDSEFETHSIRLMGYVSDLDLASLYSGAAGFVYLSVYEGFGLPILESLSCGCPVLASDIPVFRELFNPWVMFTEHTNVASVSKSLIKLVDNPILPPPRYQLQEKFNWNQTSKVIQDISNT